MHEFKPSNSLQNIQNKKFSVFMGSVRLPCHSFMSFSQNTDFNSNHNLLSITLTMSETTLLWWTMHDLTPAITKTIQDASIEQQRNNLTELARNEWICWMTIPKKEETREKHLIRFVEGIHEGKKRPCCRPGCPHHRESAKKWFK